MKGGDGWRQEVENRFSANYSHSVARMYRIQVSINIKCRRKRSFSNSPNLKPFAAEHNGNICSCFRFHYGELFDRFFSFSSPEHSFPHTRHIREKRPLYTDINRRRFVQYSCEREREKFAYVMWNECGMFVTSSARVYIAKNQFR